MIAFLVGTMSSWAQDEVFPAIDGLSWSIDERVFAGGRRSVGRAFLDGRRVYGIHRVAGRDKNGAVRFLFGDTPRVAPGMRWSASADADTVARALRAAYGPGPSPRVHEAFWAGDGALVPVWVVDLIAAGPATWRVWVDARTGRPLRADKTSREAKGEIYAINPVLSLPEVVELPNLQSETSLVGTQVYTSSCDEWVISESLFGLTACLSRSTHVLADAQGDFLFPQQPDSYDDPAAEVHAYYHVDKMSTWLSERAGIVLPYAPIQVMTNFAWANAMFGDFDGDGVPDVSFGQDDVTGIDLAYDAEVVYHELGHAVVGQLAPELPFVSGDEYGLEWAAGAVNEGAADVFSMILTGDPLLGEYAGQAFDRTSIREVSAPRRCPDSLQGEVHADGEILGSLGWRLLSDPAVGTDAVTDLLLGAIPLWGPDTSWSTIGLSLRLTADDLLDAGAITPQAHTVITDTLIEWNLEDCGRVVPVAEGTSQTRLLFTGGLLGDLERLPAGTQLSIEVPEDATAVKLVVSSFDAMDGMGYAWLGRVGEPVHNEWTIIELLGLGFAVPDTFDWERGKLVGPTVTEIVPGGDPPLIPGETLYLELASDNLGTLEPLVFGFGRIVVSAEIEHESPEIATEKRGCGCGGAQGASGWVIAASVLALAGIPRRQVRRSLWS